MSSNSSPSAPLRRLTQAELDAFLSKAADILRGNVDHSEFRAYVFALLFFKRISDVYEEEVRILADQLGDAELARDPKMHNFVVPEETLFHVVARRPRNELGTALNEAMIAIERANQPKFDGILTNRIDFNKSDELPRAKLINLINHFSSQVFDKAHVSDDVFGNAYEHLIRNFASKAGKSSGEFYTPAEVAFLMAELSEPQEGHSVCDWAAGSGGLLLQSRNYVRRHGGDPNRLNLYAQESNSATYNISRINMILHGVPSWTHKQGDSLRKPRLVDADDRMVEFDRILMNPPFSLEDWGGDELATSDPHDRFGYGAPPRDNGDYAWLEHVLKSLDKDGKAVVVMSQGVLFRGAPEQTVEVDGRNQRADAEYVIRQGFCAADVIEAIIVLPSKLFYGNNVPACLLVLNKNKTEERRNKILMIWASRHFQKSNPQNLLRPCDLMRILVPWRAYGDLDSALKLVDEQHAALVAYEEAERDRRLRDIDDAFAPLLADLDAKRAEFDALSAATYKAWNEAPTSEHPVFGNLFESSLAGAERRSAVAEAKKLYTSRVKELRREIREAEKLQLERDAREAEIRNVFDNEIRDIDEAADDLRRICADPDEARRYFTVAESSEVAANEHNLNLPRYVDTFIPEPALDVTEAAAELSEAKRRSDEAVEELAALLEQYDIAAM